MRPITDESRMKIIYIRIAENYPDDLFEEYSNIDENI